MEDMGLKVSKAQLKLHDLEQQEKLAREKAWADDSAATNCKACTKAFGLSRRKHHCRSCGGIFCAECSDNRMPLPSSAKPVRVCDVCEKELLRKMTGGV